MHPMSRIVSSVALVCCAEVHAPSAVPARRSATDAITLYPALRAGSVLAFFVVISFVWFRTGLLPPNRFLAYFCTSDGVQASTMPSWLATCSAGELGAVLRSPAPSAHAPRASAALSAIAYWVARPMVDSLMS